MKTAIISSRLIGDKSNIDTKCHQTPIPSFDHVIRVVHYMNIIQTYTITSKKAIYKRNDIGYIEEAF